MKVAVGHSEELDSAEAVDEVIEACKEQLGDSEPCAAVLFCAIDYDFQVVLDRIADAFPTAKLVGCTTDGELSSASGYRDDSLVLTLLCPNEAKVGAGLGRNVIADPHRAAEEAVAAARADLGDRTPAMCVTTPQGMKSTGSRVTQGVVQALGGGTPVSGGISADQWQFTQTYQFFGREVLTDCVPVLLLSDPIRYGRGAWSGWMPVGLRARAETDGTLVRRIGDRTAVEFIRKYLGASAEPNSECPLAIFEPDTEEFYLRSVVFHEEETGVIRLAKEIPAGSEVQLTQATRDNILLGAERSVTQALAEYPGEQPDIGLFFSCAARKEILGTRCKAEDDVIRRLIPEDTPYAGFYAYGEIGPAVPGPRESTAFHSETLVTLLIGES